MHVYGHFHALVESVKCPSFVNDTCLIRIILVLLRIMLCKSHHIIPSQPTQTNQDFGSERNNF